jgi:gamma-glutamylcyclotransferase (GGCT)/AIG2-like uncharacterized protein YtfP
MMMNKLYKVFVYGTLRQHERNHYLLENATCMATQCWTHGALYDTGLGFPAMALNKEKRVYGELYEVNEEQLKKLDWLEGYVGESLDNHYDRISQHVYTNDGVFEALVYVYPHGKEADLIEIPFGDWKCHRFLQNDRFTYFAYGSCMDDERFITSGVHEHFTTVVGCGIAKGYRLAFTRKTFDGGRADMVEDENEIVEGKVYDISKEVLPYLFRREGVLGEIYRPAFIDIEMNGHLQADVLTFLVIEKEEETPPPNHYAQEIIRGAKGFVSDDYYETLSKKCKLDS